MCGGGRAAGEEKDGLEIITWPLEDTPVECRSLRVPESPGQAVGGNEGTTEQSEAQGCFQV